MIRALNDTVSYWAELKCYCVFYAGDEIILRAENDADAIKEGAGIIAELDKFYSGT
jgi:hypothetical protein